MNVRAEGGEQTVVLVWFLKGRNKDIGGDSQPSFRAQEELVKKNLWSFLDRYRLVWFQN